MNLRITWPQRLANLFVAAVAIYAVIAAGNVLGSVLKDVLTLSADPSARTDRYAHSGGLTAAMVLLVVWGGIAGYRSLRSALALITHDDAGGDLPTGAVPRSNVREWTNHEVGLLERARAFAPAFTWSLSMKGNVPELVGRSQDPDVSLPRTALQFAPGRWTSGEMTIDGQRQLFGETPTASGGVLLWHLSTIEGDTL